MVKCSIILLDHSIAYTHESYMDRCPFPSYSPSDDLLTKYRLVTECEKGTYQRKSEVV